ncbi:MAG: hypothetical protein ACOYMB_00165 [Patescibacteria group bacterium]
MKKLRSVISESPLTSLIIVLLIAVASTAGTMHFYRASMIHDGIYAVRENRIIELKGDAELPLYGEAIANLNTIPDDVTSIVIGSGFGRFTPGTKNSDLVYHSNPINGGGDFYDVSVILKVGDYIELKNSGSNTLETSKLTKNFTLIERKQMVANAVEQINDKN